MLIVISATANVGWACWLFPVGLVVYHFSGETLCDDLEMAGILCCSAIIVLAAADIETVKLPTSVDLW